MIYLWQNLQVEIGSSRPYAYNSDSHNNSIDTTADVYPIRVTGDQLSCTGKPTCATRHADKSEGSCYKTTFGDWQCYFDQVFNVTQSTVELPAPKNVLKETPRPKQKGAACATPAKCHLASNTRHYPMPK